MARNREKALARQVRYNKSAKGRARAHRYNTSEKGAQNKQKFYERQNEKGLCQQCPEPVAPGRKFCRRHLAAPRERDFLAGGS